MLKLLDLFSGIGGFSLGLERTGGFKTIQFCEIDPFCRKVLNKHWPEVPIHDDIRTLSRANGFADVICGGFPCQDLSYAGKGAGINAGTRSGLWADYARIIGEVRPRYAIVENVSALLTRGLDRVLGDLAQIGYDAEWHCIPAAAVGAPHRRDRIWIVAYPNASIRWGGRFSDSSGEIPYPHNTGRKEQRITFSIAEGLAAVKLSGGWATEPNVGRVANGISNRAHRLKSLGNAVVPQIPELIGRAILSAEAASPEEN